MKRITKANRKKLYQHVINILEGEPTYMKYICNELLFQLRDQNDNQHLLAIAVITPDNFPELFLFKEENSGSAWLSLTRLWEVTGTDEETTKEIHKYKLNVLYLCIEMCK